MNSVGYVSKSDLRQQQDRIKKKIIANVTLQQSWVGFIFIFWKWESFMYQYNAAHTEGLIKHWIECAYSKVTCYNL